eukprot:maker-scaffold95_size379157-snap-gene-2.40 protein:Tk00607 transcript:maker-scaffold95_size379157-snap-gene-2.40-mRNA-1 annotation:"hypothetical protein CAPTEDRAFT_176851"
MSDSLPASHGEIVPVHDNVKAVLHQLSLDPVPAWPVVSGSQDDYGIVPWQTEPLGLEDLDEGWRRKALDEVQEKPEWRDRDIQAFRDLLEDQAHLNCPTNDEFLLKFLRAQKFDYERALTMLTRYFKMREVNPSNFAKAQPSLAASILAHQQQTILPVRDRLGRRILLFRAGIWDPYHVSLSDIFAANYLLLELMALEPRTQVAGLVMVVDLAGFCFSHFMHVSRDHVKSVANIIQNTFPLRFREIHIINESYLFDMVFALIKPFLSETIRSRIRFHGSHLNTLHTTIDPSVLPQEFGGSTGPMKNNDVVEVLKKHEAFFQELSTYGLKTNVDSNDDRPNHPYQSYCLSSPIEEP